MEKKRVTISDIAAKTGYSKTTVSFAFNWPNRISPETVKKVIDCAMDIGYKCPCDTVDEANRFKVICIFLPEEVPSGNVPIWGGALTAVYKLCSEHGFVLCLVSEKRMTDGFFLKTGPIDAFMFFNCIDVEPAFLETAKKRRIPVLGISLETNVADENEKKLERVNNAIQCAEYVLDIIMKAEKPRIPEKKAYTLFEANL